MLEGRKRTAVLLIVVGVLSLFLGGVTVGFVLVTPNQYFLSPIYWAGVVFFFAFAFDIADKRTAPLKTRFVMIAGLLVPAIVGRLYYSDAYAFDWGLSGLFVGFGGKAFYDMGFKERRAYCPGCGRKGFIIRKHGKWYCERMGHEVERGAVLPTGLTGLSTGIPGLEVGSTVEPVSSGSEYADERYIGGFSSINLSPGSGVWGYGIYVTSKRFFGLGLRSAGVPETAREFTWLIPRTVTDEQNRLMIGELEKKRELVIAKTDITSMTIREPPGIFRAGHLRIALRSGGSVDIGIGKDAIYGQLLTLMEAFYEELEVQ